MGVVTAGVHDADHVAVPLGLDFRREGHADLFGHRKRVHVGAQGHHRAGQRTDQQAHHTGVRDTFLHLVHAQALEVLGHQLARAELAVAELGVLVDVAPPADELLFDGLGGDVDGCC